MDGVNSNFTNRSSPDNIEDKMLNAADDLQFKGWTSIVIDELQFTWKVCTQKYQLYRTPPPKCE